MGRKVLTEEEFFEQVKNYKSPEEPTIVGPMPGIAQPESGVIPIDILYGLGVLMYQDKTGIGRLFKKEVLAYSSIKFSDFTSTQIEYGVKNPDLVQVGRGWHKDHPFRVEYQANMSLQQDAYLADALKSKNKFAADIVLNLLGEDNIERCIEVLEWMTGGAIPHLSVFSTSKVPEKRSIPIIDLSPNSYASIYLRSSIKDQRQSTWVYAPDKYYKRC